MKYEITERDREETRRIMEDVSRGFIDDREIECPPRRRPTAAKRPAAAKAVDRTASRTRTSDRRPGTAA